MRKNYNIFISSIFALSLLIFSKGSFSQDMSQWHQNSEVGIHHLTKINGIYIRNLEYNGANVTATLFINDNGETRLTFSEKLPDIPITINGRNQLYNGKLNISFSNGMNIQAEAITIVSRPTQNSKPKVFPRLYLSSLNDNDIIPKYLLGDYKATSGSQAFNSDFLERRFYFQLVRYSNKVPVALSSNYPESNGNALITESKKSTVGHQEIVGRKGESKFHSIQALKEENEKLQLEIESIKKKIAYIKEKKLATPASKISRARVDKLNNDLRKTYVVVFSCHDEYGAGNDFVLAQTLITFADDPQVLQGAISSSSGHCISRYDVVDGVNVRGKGDLVYSARGIDYYLLKDGTMTFGIVGK